MYSKKAVFVATCVQLIGIPCLSVVRLKLNLTQDELEDQEESASKHGRNSKLQLNTRKNERRRIFWTRLR